MAKARARVHSFVQKAIVLVLASHNLDVCRKWCNKALWLEQGHAHAFGAVADVIDTYQATVI